MLSIEGFRKMLQARIDAQTPFLAYWHPNGFAVMNTGEYETIEYDVMVGNIGNLKKRHAVTDLARDYIVLAARQKGERIDSIKAVKKRRKTKASTVTAMRKAVAHLQKDLPCSVYAIEFDGSNLDVLSELKM